MTGDERLLVLAGGLEAGAATMKARSLFNLKGWVQKFPGDKPEDFEIKDIKEIPCGFAGCAAGFGAAMPELRKEGLHLERECNYERHQLCPVFGVGRGWQALDMFFELRETEVYYLFDEDYYLPEERTDPLAVAARIRALVQKRPTTEQIRDQVDEATNVSINRGY